MLLTDANLARIQVHPTQGPALRYRAEIDGLRAVAVLPVLLFHAGVGWFSGGYVGVDIFFVISGYLITGIIWSEVEDCRFSLVNFYERRVRRIAPCLLAVCAFVLAAGYVFFLPGDLIALVRNMIATLGFVANVDLAFQTGYFAAPADTKPLLHTWSLAVEEQYYLFFPLLLLIIHRYARRAAVPLLAGLTMASLLLCIAATQLVPVLAFYLAPSRIWELCVGSLLALGALPAVEGKARHYLSLIGIGLIMASIFLFSDQTPFPGAFALVPVVGTALVIHCSQGTLVGRGLSLRLPVFVGLISYSLYLWHWPLIVLTRYRLDRELLPTEILAVVAASLVVAVLSWRFIEQPFRNRRKIGRTTIFASAGTVAACLALAAAAIWASHGLPGRFGPGVLGFAAGADDFSPARDRCHRGERKDWPIQDSCTYGADVAPAYAVWGDSQGVEIAYALGEVAERHDAAVMHLTYSACPPALGYRPPERLGCSGFNARAFDFLVNSPSIHTVALVALYDTPDFRTRPELREGITRSINGLLRAGKRVVLVGPTPLFPYQVPRRLALHAADGAGELNGEPAARFLARTRGVFSLFDSFTQPEVIRLYPHRVLCREFCLLTVDGKPLYFDNHHLTVTGARLVARMFEPLFLDTGRRAPTVSSNDPATDPNIVREEQSQESPSIPAGAH